ncbi:DUF1707 SHOCT-like domain-containing protein [Actinomadura xylanilytica]|uniref:DUF1707 SHOCT-like domain-containing protein n=1 Tax=Actinomadura xylanilytica TaxID=887459 RepID=UPI00255A8305|nr:DUF1707 domain-containing protein [Actinomadura xylanilytica]MDL4774763.1 DUF1707 domain-containing protein [Actinomadura xylanilytica]
MSQPTPQPGRRPSPVRPQDPHPDRQQDLRPDRPPPAPAEPVPVDPVPVERPKAGPVPSSGGASDPVPGGSVRASDAEREAVVERLRVASVEGRLTFEELTERTGSAYRAVTRGDLDHIIADLPGMGAPGAEPAPPQVQRRFTAIMGDCKERIVGRIDERLEALSVMGDVELDLRGAQVPTGEVVVSATAVMGDIKIIVPDGVSVELTGYTLMGDRRVSVREAPAGSRIPVVRVAAHAVMGDVRIVDDEHHAPLRNALSSWWEGRRDRDA